MTTCRTPRGFRGRGFTLIELLVVVSIVALLVAVLLPALGKAKRAAKAAQCLSNQRQLAIATTNYRHDHRDCFPQPGHDEHIPDAAGSTASTAALRRQGSAVWFNALDYYLQQQLRNYSTTSTTERNYNEFKQDPVSKDWDTATRDDNRTIKMNEFFGHITSDSGPANTWAYYREPDVKQPGRTLLFVDGRSLDTPSSTTGTVDTAGGRLFHVREVYVGLRHDDGANATLVDGSAAHRRSAIRVVAGTGYRGWFNNDDATATNRPPVTFRFR